MAVAHPPAQRVEPPANWTVAHMLSAPTYAKSFVTVVDRAIADGEQSRLLPLAMVLRLFGFGGDGGGSGRMVTRVRQALSPTGLVIGFARQSLGLPESLSFGPARDLQGVNLITPGGVAPPAAKAEGA